MRYQKSLQRQQSLRPEKLFSTQQRKPSARMPQPFAQWGSLTQTGAEYKANTMASPERQLHLLR
jgi:hypothetical protein